jgi:hypothetical protein
MEQAKAYKYKLSRLIKAVAGFRKVVEIDVSKFNLLIKDAIKNARIQKFEYCTELLWKTIKTFLYLNDKVDVKTPAQTMKAFLNAGYID